MSSNIFDSLLTISKIQDISQRLSARTPPALPPAPQSGAKVNYSAADPHMPTRSWDLSAVTFNAPPSAGATSVEGANAAYAAYAAIGSLMGAEDAPQGSLVNPDALATTARVAQLQNASNAMLARHDQSEAGTEQPMG